MKRYDLVQTTSGYTSDHEMQRSDDGEWVRFEEIETGNPASREPLGSLRSEALKKHSHDSGGVAVKRSAPLGAYVRRSGRHRSTISEQLDKLEGVYEHGNE